MPGTQTKTRRETSPQTQSSPYSRDNYYSSIGEEYDPERETLDPSTHEHDSSSGQKRGTTKDEWIVRTLKRDRATMLCPFTLHEDPSRCPYDCETYLEEGECDHESYNLHEENRQVELTDPEVYPPTATTRASPRSDAARKSPSTNRWRVNEEYGYIVFGGVIQDEPKEDLLEFVDEMIAAMDCEPLEREIREAKELADDLKTAGDHRDVDILRKVVKKILGGPS